MRMYGELGSKVDGDYWAQEFAWVDRENDEVEILINSNGGNFSQGLSVVSEILNAKSRVTCTNVGIAASMAVPILMAADHVRCYDYAKIMIHSPYYVDTKGEAVKQLSAKDRKALAMLKDTLTQLLTKRGMSVEQVEDMMKTDTWLTPKEAMDLGIVDEIVSTGRKELMNLEPLQLVAKLKEENSKLNNSNLNMKEVFAKLGLPAESDEQAVVAAIEKLQNVEPKTVEVIKASDKVVAKMLAVGKKAGLITAKNEAAMKQLAETNLDLFVDLIDEEKITKPEGGVDGPRLSEVLAKLNTGGKEPEVVKDFAWYSKNEPKALLKMQEEEPDKYKELVTNYAKQ